MKRKIMSILIMVVGLLCPTTVFAKETDHQLTQKDIIEATGLGKVTVSRLMSGKYYDFRLSTLDKICKFFDCKITDILEQDDD